MKVENDKNEESILGKVTSLFSSKKNKEDGDEILEAKIDKEGFFDGIRNKLFGSEPVDVIDVEAFEIVTADMELVVIEHEIDESGKVTEHREIVSMDTMEAGKGILDTLSDTANSALDAIKSTANSSWEFTTDKLSSAQGATVAFSTSTADSLVHYTKQVGKRYDDMELSPKFYSFINTIDLLVVITGLQVLLDKQKKGSKEFIALSVVLGVLLLLDRSKEEMKKEMGFIEINDELNQDLSALLKSVTFKDVVETAEPILLIIPNGNYILLILKLFV